MSHEKAVLLRRLFRDCLHLSCDEAVVARALESLQRFPVSEVSRYFDAHETALAPLLFWHLHRRGLACHLSRALAADVELRYRRNVARNTVLRHSLADVAANFAPARIDVLVLKGASIFTETLSQFRGAFVLSDIDLMVRPSDMDRAARRLCSAGYVATQKLSTPHGLKLGFAAADGIARIDLHSALFWTNGVGHVDFDTEDLWQDSVPAAVAGFPVRVLSQEAQLSYRLVHDAFGHDGCILLRGVCRLYQFCVLADFYRDTIDWNALLDRLGRHGSDRVLAAFLHHGRQQIGFTLPTPLQQRHPRCRTDLALLEAVRDSSDRLLNYSNRIAMARLAHATLGDRLTWAARSFRRDCPSMPVEDGPAFRTVVAAVHTLVTMTKMACLQMAAVVYIAAHSLRRLGVRRRRACGMKRTDRVSGTTSSIVSSRTARSSTTH